MTDATPGAVTEMHQRVQEELKIEVESVSALQWERSKVQEQLQQEQEDREREKERMVQMIANLAEKESEQEEDMKTARERVEEMEVREREMKTLLELQLEEAKQREAALKTTEVKERENRGALEDELKLASASILRLERYGEELRARSQKAEDLAREKVVALNGELKREQDAVEALKVDIKVEKEKAAAVLAQEQERASELAQKLTIARESVLQSERREQEAVATLEVYASINAQFRVLTHTCKPTHAHIHIRRESLPRYSDQHPKRARLHVSSRARRGYAQY